MSVTLPTDLEFLPVKFIEEKEEKHLKQEKITQVATKDLLRESPVDFTSSPRLLNRCYSIDSVEQTSNRNLFSDSRDGVTPYIGSGDTNTPNPLYECVKRISGLMNDLEAAKSHDSDTSIKSSFENLISHCGNYIKEQTGVSLDPNTFVEEGWINRESLTIALERILNTLQQSIEPFSPVAFDSSEL